MEVAVERYRVEPDQPLQLQTLLGDSLPVHVRALRLDVSSSGCVVEADLELAGDEYARCLYEGHLGLDVPGRGLGPEPDLARPVRIVARLRTHLASRLATTPAPMEALIDELFAPPAPLAHADAWRALDVTQQIDELGVAMGYRTAWAGEGSSS